MAQPKLGSGGRFKALVGKLSGKVDNPAAVAASIGRKKYGNERFQKLAEHGKNSANNPIPLTGTANTMPQHAIDDECIARLKADTIYEPGVLRNNSYYNGSGQENAGSARKDDAINDREVQRTDRKPDISENHE